MSILTKLGNFFNSNTNLDLTQIVMPHIKEAVETFHLEVYDFYEYSICLKSIIETNLGHKIKIELQENGEYMVKVNNNNTVNDVPLGLINHLIFTELKMN